MATRSINLTDKEQEDILDGVVPPFQIGGSRGIPIQNIPYEQIVASLWYAGKTGHIHSKKTYAILGYKDKGGYLRCHVGGRTVSIHRLAWYLYHKRNPEYDIDHINGIRDDNRITNLRDVPTRDNTCNQFIHRDGKLPGCYQHSKTGTWVSQVTIGQDVHYLGLYRTELEAHHAYVDVVQGVKTLDDVRKVVKPHNDLHKGIHYASRYGSYVLQWQIDGKQQWIAQRRSLEELKLIKDALLNKLGETDAK